MSKCLGKLFDAPVVTRTEILINKQMDYPAITFCFKNSNGSGYDKEILQVYLH